MAMIQEPIKIVHADECMDVRDGTHDSPQSLQTGIPLVTSKNLVNGKIDFSTCNFISEEDHEAISKRSKVDDGDILYAMIGTIGNPVIVSKDCDFSIKNVALFKFNNPDVYNRYIYHFLNSDVAKKQLAKLSRGGTQKFVSLGNLRKLKIPLPPLSEQRRIASILDQADELRQKRQQAIEKLDQLLQATFIDMFGDPVSNSKGWEVLKWRDALKIINGKNQKAVLDQNGIFPICGSGGVMGYANEWLTPAKSVIIGRKGNINKPILMFENFWNVDTAFGLVPNKDVLNADYLFWFCHFFNFEQLNKTVTIPSLTKSDLLNIDIPTPPLDKQLCFSNICDQTRILKSKMELKDLNLFSSLQNQAFNGTL
ncbi:MULTISPECIES: restriction endonuclease subunit S [Acinetobacter]|uniref:restriction endonuclease subunit S n=1 Tax=Acinetobacter TaxID=469 RepID=UPI001D1846D1|nr:restriction endonuclease subunit S [Acinetobacter junii]